MSQDLLCETAGLTVRHLIRLEQGWHSPSTRTLSRIAEATEQPLDFFRPEPGQDRASDTTAAA